MTKSNKIIEELFIKLMPVQILIFIMGSINYIVDGAIAGRCIESATVGVVGLYYAMTCVLDAVGNVLLGGTAVLCGRSMGEGDMERTNRIFSLNMIVTFAVGALITAASFAFPAALAKMLGANDELSEPLQLYITGFAVGIIPRLLGQQIASFLQMERQSTRGFIGVVGMIVSNIFLDLLFVYVLKLGIHGLALATAASNWIYFMILAPYYFGNRSQLKLKVSDAGWNDLGSLIRIGAPGAMLIICLAIRAIILNKLLLHYSGNAGLSALASYNLLNGFFVAFALGTGAVVRMLGSVYVGEGDKESIKAMMSVVIRKVIPASFILTVIIFLLSAPISSLFFPDKTTEVYRLTLQLLQIYAFCIPLIVAIQTAANYLQAAGYTAFVHILSVLDGVVAMVIPSLILAPVMGAVGVWISVPVGLVITALSVPVYIIFFWKKVPRSIDEWLLITPEFSVDDADRLSITINSRDESINRVIETSETVQEFCRAHNVDPTKSYYAALCLEEMAGNIVEHGFTNDRHEHNIDIRVIYKEGTVMLRLKDDCIPFDPQERRDMNSSEDPFKNIGIRMVKQIADEMMYQSNFGLNVLTMKLIDSHNN